MPGCAGLGAGLGRCRADRVGRVGVTVPFPVGGHDAGPLLPVQAGERIIFAQDNGQVTAHIQIQYQGDAKDFGWLLPLPAVQTKSMRSTRRIRLRPSIPPRTG